MNIEFEPLLNKTYLVPLSVYERTATFNNPDEILVAEIDPTCADGNTLCETYNLDHKMSIKCLIVESNDDDKEKVRAAILLPIDYKYSSSTVKKILESRDVTFSPLEEIIEATGMEYGSITPIGLPENYHILIDPLVLDNERIIVGGGLKKSKILMPSQTLLEIPNSKIVENLSKVDEM